MRRLPGARSFLHRGTGTTVIACHGFTGAPQSMSPLLESLSGRGWTVTAPLLPGHGTSWRLCNRTRWQEWYAAIEDEYCLWAPQSTSIHLVGLSMGGALALRLAAIHAPRIASVTLINPALRVDNALMPMLPVIARALPGLPLKIGNDINNPDGPREICYDRLPTRALLSQTRLWRDTTARLAAVRAPVLLFRSIHDHVVPGSSSDVVVSGVIGAQVTVVELADSYHVATLDHDAPLIAARTAEFITQATTPPVPVTEPGASVPIGSTR